MERLLLAAALMFALAGTLIVTGHDVIGSLLILVAFVVAVRALPRTSQAEVWHEPITNFDDEALTAGRSRAGEGRVE